MYNWVYDNYMSKTQKRSIRLPQRTITQLDELVTMEVERDRTKLIILAVERLYQDEKRKDKKE